MKLLRLLTLASVLLPAATALTHGATRDEIYNQAEADRNAGRNEAAVTGYTEVLKTDARNGHTWVRRGVSLHNLGRYSEAVLDYCRAHAAFVLANEDKSARAIALTNRADSALRSGDVAGAFADAFAASKIDETYARARSGIADAWYEAGNLREAQSYLAQAQKIDPAISRSFTAEGAAAKGRGRTQPDDKANTDAEFKAAVEAYNKKDYAEALALYDKILAKQPLNAGAWGNRGNALKELRRTEDAIISQSRAAALEGAFAGNREKVARHFTNRLNCWLDLGDTEAALIDGELATRAHPDAVRSWQRLAVAWFQWGDLAKAEQFIAEAKKRDAEFKGYSDFTATNARANFCKRLARGGDRKALAELVQSAITNRPGIFETNAVRTGAIAVLDELLKKSPRDVDLLVLRAQAEDAPSSSMKLSTNKDALEWIDKAVALEPNNGNALLVRGLLRINLSEEDKDLQELGWPDLDRAIQLGAGTAEAFSERGDHAAGKKDHAAAAADYSSALRLTPDDPSLLYRRAREYAELKQWPKAIADHNRRVEVSVDEVTLSDRKNVARKTALYDRAEAFANSGDYAKAITDYDAAIDLEAKNPDYFLGRARAHRLAGDKDKARADIVAARKLDQFLPPLASDLSNAAEIEELRHDLKHAFKRMSKAMDAVSEASAEVMKAERAKNRAEARLQRMFAGDKRTAEDVIKEVDRAEEDEDADAEDYRDKARALAKLNRLDEALTALDEALKLDETHAGAHSMRGRLHEARKEYDLAFADYDRAVALSPKDADYRRDRGDIWWERQNFAKAYADYDEAVKLDEKSAENWFKRGNAQYKLGRIAEAVADYDKAIALDPEFTNAKKNREILQRQLGAK